MEHRCLASWYKMKGHCHAADTFCSIKKDAWVSPLDRIEARPKGLRQRTPQRKAPTELVVEPTKIGTGAETKSSSGVSALFCCQTSKLFT